MIEISFWNKSYLYYLLAVICSAEERLNFSVFKMSTTKPRRCVLCPLSTLWSRPIKLLMLWRCWGIEQDGRLQLYFFSLLTLFKVTQQTRNIFNSLNSFCVILVGFSIWLHLNTSLQRQHAFNKNSYQVEKCDIYSNFFQKGKYP